jgi:hypothetical protein
LRYERLEARRLLTQIHGTVREDLNGDRQMDVAEPGIAGVTVYLDLNHNGQRDLDEPNATTAQDDPSTPGDETGTYLLDAQPGTFVVRQDLPRPERFTQADPQPLYLQMAPLFDAQLGDPSQSPSARRLNQYNPLEYTFEFHGRVKAIHHELPDAWRELNVDDAWSLSIDYSYDPGEQPQFNPLLQSFDFRPANEFLLRFHSSDSTVGWGETAKVSDGGSQFSLVAGATGPMLRVTLPLQAAPNFQLVLETELRDDLQLGQRPRAGDIRLSQDPGVARFQVVQTENDARLILEGVVEAHQFDARRADRFGQVVQLPEDAEPPIDFWNAMDHDLDGIPTPWEIGGGGIDVNLDGIVDLDLFARGASPFHKDLFVEVDAMQGRGPLARDHDRFDYSAAGVTPTYTVLDRVIQAFARAPVQNPDGVDGIRLHIELDETTIPLEPFVDANQPWAEFDRIKADHAGGGDRRADSANRANIVAARNLVFRYGLFADTRANGSSGLAELPGNDFFVSLGDWRFEDDAGILHPGGSADQQTGTFMHELGHTMGLHHGGSDDLNYKPNYLSVMNYHWQVPNQNVGWSLDYSRQALPDLKPADLDERSGIGAVADDRRHVLTGPKPLRHLPVAGAVDWSRDGDQLDTNVASEIYTGYFPDHDGVRRFYRMNAGAGGASLEFTLHGHNDWDLPAEDFLFLDDPSFPDGVHACDNPENDQTNCYDDMTDFFTLSVSPDQFEPDGPLFPLDIPLVVPSDYFDVDLDAGISWGVFSLHNVTDQDWFVWSPQQAGGRFIASISYVPGQTVDVAVLDRDGNSIGTQVVRNGRVDIQLDLPTQMNGNLIVRVRDHEFDPQQMPDPQVDPANSYHYRLEVYAPRHLNHPGSHWHGDDAASGAPGDGASWNDARNWQTQQAIDAAAEPQSDHTFFAAPTVSTIDLNGNRQAESLQFRGSYVICNVPCSDQLEIGQGIIDVFPYITATLNADIAIGGAALTKRNQGTLVVNGDVPSIRVKDGSLHGSATIHGALDVAARAVLSPGPVPAAGVSAAAGTVVVASEAYVEGTLQIDVTGSNSDRLIASSIRLAPSSALIVQARGALDVQRSERSYTVVSAPIEVHESSDRETFATVRGPDPNAAQHAGFGVFLRDTIYDDAHASIDLRLYQAGAGDADGDGQFDSSDLVKVFVAGKYETNLPADWTEGDWTGDSRFSTDDLIAAFQQGTYETVPGAQVAFVEVAENVGHRGQRSISTRVESDKQMAMTDLVGYWLDAACQKRVKREWPSPSD